MTPLQFTISILWAVAAAGLAAYCARVAAQITYVTLADGRRQERQMPVLIRLMLPLTSNLFPLFRSATFNNAKTKASQRIVTAGFDGLLSAEEFLSLQCLLPLLLGPLWALFVSLSLSTVHGAFIHNIAWLLYLLGPLWLWAYPHLWLQQALNARQRSIRRALPFMLDLLTLSVEAGMDFMTALQRAVERRQVDAFAEELIRMVREIQLGKTRRQALRDMAIRVDLHDLRSGLWNRLTERGRHEWLREEVEHYEERETYERDPQTLWLRISRMRSRASGEGGPRD
jgi:hypothetical protein